MRTARKHIGWYVRTLHGGEAFRGRMNGLENCRAQLDAVNEFFDGLGERMDRIPGASHGPNATADELMNNDKKKEEAAP